jgi:methionyl aminopeptidase
MVFTIEPMVNQGDSRIKTKKDGWTVVTRDKNSPRNGSTPWPSPPTDLRC